MMVKAFIKAIRQNLASTVSMDQWIVNLLTLTTDSINLILPLSITQYVVGRIRPVDCCCKARDVVIVAVQNAHLY